MSHKLASFGRMSIRPSISPRTLRWLLAGFLIIALLAGLLALDLANHGLAWQTAWSLTGEEQPLAQVRGMVEWLGNFTRLQPNTAPLTPIDHVDVNPFGINTFLEQEVEPEKRERSVQMIADAGFHWLRQEFPWEDIEIHGRGDFVDRRNDHDGDGQPDPVDAWAKYDNIVDLADQYGLEIQARLSNPPSWAHANPDIGEKAPPDDLQDYINYAVAVAERYRGRIRYYQVWNEPNIYPEWGNQDVSPEAYTNLLCRTYDALKAVDPEIVVISGALAGTVSLSGRDLNDFIFLQRMYDAGAGACFDIMSVQAYGLNSGPTDRRMRPTTVTFARHEYIRDLMVANGDAHKPIWISEAAWNPVDEPDVPPDIPLREQYGTGTQEQAARYMPLAYQRAQEEWPWIGVINYWFFKRASDAERNQPFYYFRMVEPDFTPLPIYDAMRDYIHNHQPVLYPGVHQAENEGISWWQDASRIVPIEGAQFGRASEGEISPLANFTVHGTDMVIRWRGEESLRVEIDGWQVWLFMPTRVFNLTSSQNQLVDLPGDQTLEGYPIGFILLDRSDNGWYEIVIPLSQNAEAHRIEISGFSVGQADGVNLRVQRTALGATDFLAPLTLDSITVLDRTFENVFPLAASVAIAVGMTLWVVASALRARRQ
jgi:hypothetical protein